MKSRGTNLEQVLAILDTGASPDGWQVLINSGGLAYLPRKWDVVLKHASASTKARHLRKARREIDKELLKVVGNALEES